MKVSFLTLLLIFIIGSVFSNEVNLNKVVQLEVSSSINPVVFEHLKLGFKKAHKDNFGLILIKLNTPGGGVKSTKEILTLIGESEIPVAVWVTPEGASASSAGSFISAGAHYLFMSNGTNMGAATPITVSGDIKQKDSRNKAVNDLVALVKSQAETRGRNSDLFAEMIKKASSYTAEELLKQQSIDSIVSNETEIIEYVNKNEVIIKGKSKKLNLNPNTDVSKIEMSLGEKILNVFADPSVAYILFILGAALLYLELQAPGGFIAGAIGVLALFLAAIGFNILPLNIGAMGLLVLAFILFTLEVYITSYGILSVAGLASLAFGSLYLFRTSEGLIDINTTLVYSTVAGVGFFLVFLLVFLFKDSKIGKMKNMFSLANKEGLVTEKINDEFFRVKVSGEIWKVHSDEELNIGDKVKVCGEDPQKLSLKVEKII